MERERELEVATELAYRAGALLRRMREGAVDVEHKAHGEAVTVADRISDAVIRAGLRSAFPDDAVYSEESPDDPARLAFARVWIVDPLDGTSNFVARGDEYSVSIGLAIDGRPALGVVCTPERGQLF